MVQRGRKSALSLLETAMTDVVVPRPQPLAELSDEEALEWIEMVNVVPADYFNRPAQTVLGQYCRHVVAARHLAQLIRQSKKFDAQYRQLLREQRAETQAIYGCLRSLRLTHLSVKPSSRTMVAASPMVRPWET
jgi:hypothetical protein